MPRPGPRRPYVAFRASEAGLEWIEAEATRRGLVHEKTGKPVVSEMIRIMLAYASQNMPQTWIPKGGSDGDLV